METDSEKLVKDSLAWATETEKILGVQKITTSMYQKEPIDFIAWDLDGKTHLIEVKETQTSSISPTAYNEVQSYLLTQEVFNQDNSPTCAWTVARFYSGDKNRNHSQYYELYFLVPGDWVAKEPITIVNCRKHEDAVLLGGYEYGEYFDIDNEHGLTTRGNATDGLKKFPFYKGSEI